MDIPLIVIDNDEEAYREFWQQFGSRLQNLASRHLPPIIARRAEPEDVVQSVCRTFFRRVQAGKFELSDSDNLWRLLCAITLTKVQKQTRFHYRQKRGVNKERPFADEEKTLLGVPEPVEQSDSPAEIVAFAEQFELLMKSLTPDEQLLVQLKLDQCSEKEIAERLNCSPRTVRRILKKIRTHLQEALEQPPP